MPAKAKTEKVKIEKEVIPIQYVVNIVNVREPYAKDERLAQISWLAAGDKLVLAVQDTRFSSDLEHFMLGNIVTAEGRTYNPFNQPKEWVLNLSKVAPKNLHRMWGASEARAIYET